MAALAGQAAAEWAAARLSPADGRSLLPPASTSPPSSATASTLPLPNVLVTGTPGVGKSAFCTRLCELTGFTHLNVGELVREKRLHEGWDEVFEAWEVDDERLCDELEQLLSAGGCVVDYHSTSTFPLRWFPLVVVLRASTHTLHERLTQRRYSPHKLRENVEAEILQVCLDEVREAWPAHQVMEMANDDVDQLEANVARTQRRLEETARAQRRQCVD